MIDNFVEQFQLPDTVIPRTGKPDAVTNTTKSEEGWFIRGPISGEWISRAAHLSGNHTLHVALAVLYVSGLRKNSKVITLERFHFDRFGVKKDSVRRALKRLREAGLIEYRKVGQRFKVTVIPTES
jgi:DNA-binding transcriptional ArsR family regulator